MGEIAVLRYKDPLTQTWLPLSSAGPAGPPGAPGEPTTLYVQPNPPDLAVHPDGYPLWLDTDEEPPAGGGGTTILSGTATPAAGTGAVGDYYLDTDDRILYGPKAATNIYGAAQSGFTSQAPDGTASIGGNSFGLDFRFAKAGRITGVRFYRHASSTQPHTMRIWLNSTTQAGPSVAMPLTGTGWVTALLPTPVEVVGGQTVRVSDEYPTDTVARLGTRPAGDYVNGNVTIVASAPSQGTYYTAGYGTYPGSSISSALYFLDIIYEPLTTAAWPVALKSPPPGGTAGQVLKKLSSTDFDWGWAT